LKISQAESKLKIVLEREKPDCTFITSYERDNESELDFAQARYYKSAHGRFTSTDPIILNEVRMRNPQVFNGYSYTSNNPLRFTDPNGEDLIAADEEQRKNIKKLAPGAKIDADGNVRKPSFFHRVLNRLTGHGDGTKLISQLVDSNKITTAATLKGFSGGQTINIDLEKTSPSSVLVGGKISDVFKNALAAQGTQVRADTNYLIVIGTGSTNERMPDGSIQSQPADTAVLLGHELIHASHYADGSFVPDKGEHYFSENGVNYVEHPSPAGREELRTSGLAYNRPGDITENSLRKELGYRPRATYVGRDKWELRK
jgi:RHS repeat-associated protein